MEPRSRPKCCPIFGYKCWMHIILKQIMPSVQICCMYGHGGTNGGGGGAWGLIRAKMAKRDHSCWSGSGPMRRLHISGLVSNGELAKGQWWRCTAAVKPHICIGVRGIILTFQQKLNITMWTLIVQKNPNLWERKYWQCIWVWPWKNVDHS